MWPPTQDAGRRRSRRRGCAVTTRPSRPMVSSVVGVASLPPSRTSRVSQQANAAEDDAGREADRDGERRRRAEPLGGGAAEAGGRRRTRRAPRWRRRRRPGRRGRRRGRRRAPARVRAATRPINPITRNVVTPASSPELVPARAGTQASHVARTRPAIASPMSKTLAALQARGLEIAAMYDELNLAQRGRTWTRAETLMGFVGDVGDLAQLATAGRRRALGLRHRRRRRTTRWRTSWPTACGPCWCWPSATRSIWRRRTAMR